MQSQTGVRQGEPLGMLLFELAMQQPLERTRDAAPGVAVVALADDVNLVGRVDVLRTAFRALQGEQGAAGIGLRDIALPQHLPCCRHPREKARLADIGFRQQRHTRIGQRGNMDDQFGNLIALGNRCRNRACVKHFG